MAHDGFTGANPFSRAYRDRLARLMLRVDQLTMLLAAARLDQGDSTGRTKVFPAFIVEAKPFPEGVIGLLVDAPVKDRWFYRFIEAAIRMPNTQGAVLGSHHGDPPSEYTLGASPELDPAGWFRPLDGGRTGWALNGLETGNTTTGAAYGVGDLYQQGAASVTVHPVGRNGLVKPVVQMLEIETGVDVDHHNMPDTVVDLVTAQFPRQYMFCAKNPIEVSCKPPDPGDPGDGGLMLL